VEPYDQRHPYAIEVQEQVMSCCGIASMTGMPSLLVEFHWRRDDGGMTAAWHDLFLNLIGVTLEARLHRFINM